MLRSRYIGIECLCACIAVVWGAFVANPNTDSFSRNPKLYAPMTEIVASEAFWGLLMVCSGVATIVCLYRKCRFAPALIMTIVWVFIGTLFFLGDVLSQAWGVYGLLGIFNAILYQYNRRQCRQLPKLQTR